MTPPKGVLCKMYAAVITQDQPIQINCAMYYSEVSPFEVVFMTDTRDEDGDPTVWHYARDLLVQGLNGESEKLYGEGDVQVFKENGFLYTMFHQGDNKVVLAFMQTDMSTFLLETDKVVPIGSEKMQEAEIDKAISELLGE